MKLYACGCNLSGQISNPATMDVSWTLIKEWESQPKDSKFENKVFMITFGFSYCVYAHDNKIFVKGFNNSIDEEIAIPKRLDNPTNDPHITIINVSTYKNHIIVIQSNGNIWKLDLLDKIKQDRIDSVKMTKHLRETKYTRREHVTNQKEMRTMENGSTAAELNEIKQSPIHNQYETIESPIEIHQTETTAISFREESDKIHTKYSQSKKCEIETLEAKCTKNNCITQSTGRNVEFPVKDIKDKCSDGFTKDNELISVTQLNHLFTCELDVCDDQTEIELEEQELKTNKDKENPVSDRTDELRSKRQRISTRKRNHFVKAVCSDKIQLLLSEQGQVFHIPGRLDHFLGHVITDIACGFDHSLALTRDGLVYSWGNGSRGQLGYPCMGADSDAPREVPALSGLGVEQIAAGGWHSVARTGEGFLYAWGWNNSGQVGVKGKLDLVVCEPTPMSWSEDMDSPDIRVVDIACGTRHTVVLCDDNSVWGCGWNAYNQLSLGSGVSQVEELSRLPLPNGASIENLFCAHWNSALLVA